MADRVLVDTGPFVALLRSDDSHHRDAVVQAAELSCPFFTSWAVLTEAAWLLRNVPHGLDGLLEFVESGMVLPLEIPPIAIPAIRSIATKYGSLRPQLADLTICRLAENVGLDIVFTFDRRDFLSYRTSIGKPFRIVPQ